MRRCLLWRGCKAVGPGVLVNISIQLLGPATSLASHCVVNRIEKKNVYTTDLLALHSRHSNLVIVDSHIAEINRSLNVPAWHACLSNHPDADFVKYIGDGPQHGFHIGIWNPPPNYAQQNPTCSQPQIILR